MDKGIKKTTASLFLMTIGIMVFFFNEPVKAAYYPLECSEHYAGYCEGQTVCFSEFGDRGIFMGGICHEMDYSYPQDYADELQALTYISYYEQSLNSSIDFTANVVGFWLPFGVIANFSMMVIYILLLKFKFFQNR